MNQIYGLDFVRFTAALLVFVFHFSFRAAVHPNDPLHAFFSASLGLPSGYLFTWFGWVGVQIFFVLSGYVIAYSCQTEDARTFIVRRFLRLAPVMWISAATCFVISVLLGFIPVTHAIVRTLRSVVFFPFGPWIAGPTWTLPIEISFYATIAILLLMGRRAWLERLAAGLAVCSAAFWIAYGTGLADPQSRVAELLLFHHGCEFALGLLLWCAIVDRLTPARIIFMIICVATSFGQIAMKAADESFGYLQRLPLAVPMGIWICAVALIYLSARFNTHAERYFAPYKTLVRQAGILTYPFYLTHVHVGGLVLYLAQRASIDYGNAVFLALLICLAFSWWISVYPEPALKRLLSHYIAELRINPDDQRMNERAVEVRFWRSSGGGG